MTTTPPPSQTPKTPKTAKRTVKTASAAAKPKAATRRTKASDDVVVEMAPVKTARARTKAASASGRNLVIVESPAKAKTIERYLGKDYKVLASVGHVIDLPPSKMGVEIENDFKPEYVVIRGKKKVLDELKAAAANAPAVYLATDPDREGEAIAWHVANYLKFPEDRLHRATFNEITKSAVQTAIANPSRVNESLCMAQQTRRILDRLVGYQISPLLWRNVQRGLSAGRVQSVAVRILCEREKEIEKFVPEEYWTIEIEAEGKTPPPFKIRLSKIDGAKAVVSSQEAADRVRTDIQDQPLIVNAIVKKPYRRNPQPPFITSSLQQEAARKCRFTPSRTMTIAQGLYEGVNIGPEGTVGLITYMRTDSTRVATTAVQGVRAFIEKTFGPNFLPETPNDYPSKKGAQDAHEAIRPTLLDRPPETLEDYLDADQLKLYRLIWIRFVASQMKPALLERTTVEVPVCDQRYLFIATGSVILFPGFLSVYEEGHDERDGQQTSNEETAERLPQLAQGEHLTRRGEIECDQHFTQPPPRFSLSSLVRELERLGIGRPSTYAAILSTIQEKKYAELLKGNFRPTELGRIVTDILVDSFPEILNVEFTAEMETELDDIEEGSREWLEVMRGFYDGFRQRLTVAEKEMKSPRGLAEPTDIPCDLCGKTMLIKWGKNGRFLSCEDYPECKNAKPLAYDEEGKIVVEKAPATDEVCPKCGGPMSVRNGKRGPFLACNRYPECDGLLNIAEVKDGKAIASEALPDTDEVCEKCGSPMRVRNSRRGPFLGCSGYPKCRNAKAIAEVKDGKAVAVQLPQVDEKCDKCGAPMIVRRGPRGLFLACSAYPKCKNAKPLEGEEGQKLAASLPRPAKPRAIQTEEKCENCGKPMMLRAGRKGYFLGCSGYPKCKTTRNAEAELVAQYIKEEE
ncbi:MAG TPA: type I DNA topoisomerase [Candidatus Sumerlaeota bacterium]|nr:type I DNA topoisomerase [Candidatus Sumerlaeota bacterium]